MRKFVAVVTALSAFVIAGEAAQQPQRSDQVFETGIDLITVDVAVFDGRGRPIEDLRSSDFTVKVDGKAREVISATLVKVDGDAPAPPAPGSAAPITTNAAVPDRRLVAIGVDQTLITPGSIRPLLRTAARFVDDLMPGDHAALITFPEPGPRVDFTTDKGRVRQAMELVVGQPAKGAERKFDLSLWEALMLDYERTIFNTERPLPPNLRLVMERVDCTGVVYCPQQVLNEAAAVALDARQEATFSIRRLESFLKELGAIEGPKSMVLISAGLLVENLAALDEVARLAAAARTSISVIAVDRERDQWETTGVPNGQSSLPLMSRQLEMTGLETIADRTGGTLYRAIGPAEGVFDRIASEMSAWYVVAVERQPGDPERQRIDVDVRRRGATVRANRTFVATSMVNRSRPAEDVLRDALSSPLAIPGVPLRVSTFVQRDAASGRYRLHLAAQVGQRGAMPGEFSVGYVVMNDANDVIASLGRRLTLAPAADGGNEPLHFDTALAIDPGKYSIRFGVVDSEGRRGMVVHPVDLLAPNDELQASDLIVGNVPAEGEVLHPDVEPHISGRVAGYLELYPGADGAEGLSVRFEIAEGAASPALATEMLNIGAGAKPEWRVASGAVGASLLPGRYVARATILRGDETLRVVSRPFVLERAAEEVSRRTDRVRGVAIAPDLQLRTASYVARVVGSLGNVVATEQFTLADPDRRVTSEFLLVRYPGSVRDLLSFRDVTHVNGAAVDGREEQLVSLFVKPVGLIRERVRQITLAAEAHVPPVLNPIFGLAFLQPDFQSRFELTVNDAGGDWPAQVKAVEFVEIARPTLLRAGPLGDLDLPTRGTAWLEEATGRILQTDVQVGSGRNAPAMVTRFRVDDRLQILVPELMRTRNPDGVATYSNFRRFNVQTDTTIPDPPR